MTLAESLRYCSKLCELRCCQSTGAEKSQHHVCDELICHWRCMAGFISSCNGLHFGALQQQHTNDHA